MPQTACARLLGSRPLEQLQAVRRLTRAASRAREQTNDRQANFCGVAGPERRYRSLPSTMRLPAGLPAEAILRDSLRLP